MRAAGVALQIRVARLLARAARAAPLERLNPARRGVLAKRSAGREGDRVPEGFDGAAGIAEAIEAQASELEGREAGARVAAMSPPERVEGALGVAEVPGGARNLGEPEEPFGARMIDERREAFGADRVVRLFEATRPREVLHDGGGATPGSDEALGSAAGGSSADAIGLGAALSIGVDDVAIGEPTLHDSPAPSARTSVGSSRRMTSTRPRSTLTEIRSGSRSRRTWKRVPTTRTSKAPSETIHERPSTCRTSSVISP